MRKVYASVCLVDPTSVPEGQCRVPEGAELNDFGKKMVEKLKHLSEHGDGDDEWSGPTTVINCYRLMPAALFTKNAHYAPASGDLVIVGGTPRNVITSAIVLRVGSFVLTNSKSVYQLGEEAKNDKELLERYPLLTCDMVPSPERDALLQSLEAHFPKVFEAIKE